MSNDALKLFSFVLVALLVIGVGVINAPDDQDLELKHYCEMVQIYRESDGEFGWPDYNNRAHLCLQEKSNDQHR